MQGGLDHANPHLHVNLRHLHVLLHTYDWGWFGNCFIKSNIFQVVVRERRRQHHDRGWALMEPFFAGAFILYAIVRRGKESDSG